MDVAFKGLSKSIEMSITQLLGDIESYGEPQIDTINALVADLHWLEDIIAECKRIRELE